jgi:hypothetical protein
MKRPSIEELRTLSASDYCDSIKFIEEQIDDAYELMLAAAKAGESETVLFNLDERAKDYFTQLGYTIKSNNIGIVIAWYPPRLDLTP